MTFKKTKNKGEIIIYKSSNNEIELEVRFENESVWLRQSEIALLFTKERSVVTKHINKIFKDKEVDKKSNVQKMHIANSDKPVEFYSLDVVLAVGYRTNSVRAIHFRKWATKVLKQHLLLGYTVNRQRVGKNYEKFLLAISDIKALLPSDVKADAGDVLELIRVYATTWVSLDAYDTDKFPKSGVSRKKILVTAEDLKFALQELRSDLISKKSASNLFLQERNKDSIDGVVGNVFQTFAKKDVYPTIEEKAAHLLYFMVKNHPFVDGNKRSGAFAFVWFLQRAGILRASLTPEALTAMTLLVAESKPVDKDKIVGLVLLLLIK